MIAAIALGLVWLVLLGLVAGSDTIARERSFVGASLLAATIALVAVLAADAMHAGGVL